MSRELSEILINTTAAVFGAIIFALVLFAFNELLIPKKNLSGEWKVIEKIARSTRQKMIGIEMEYKFHMLQKGYEIIGSGEKIREKQPNTPDVIYDPEKRVTLTIEGYMERKFFSKSKVYLHIIEDGRNRESRKSYILKVPTARLLNGILISTAASAEGGVHFTRTDHPTLVG